MNAIWVESGDHAGDSSSNDAGRQRLGLLRRDVEQLKMRSLAAKIAADVGLEVVPVDDDRLGVFGSASFLSLSFSSSATLGIRILHDEHEPLAVGRPGVIRDASLDVGQLDRFATGAIQQPDLRLLWIPDATTETRDTFRQDSTEATIPLPPTTSPGPAAGRPSSPSRRRCRSCRCP